MRRRWLVIFLLLYVALVLACGGRGIAVSPTVLARQNLSGHDFRYSDLVGQDLSGKTFVGANFEAARLAKARLRSSNLQQANMRNANMPNADCTDADLTDAIMRDAFIADTNFTRTVLEQIDFTNVSFQDTILDYASFRGSIVTEIQLAQAKSRRCMVYPDGTVYLGDGPCP